MLIHPSIQKQLLGILFLVAGIGSLHSQDPCDFIIEGNVLDRHTLDPIPYVKVLIAESGKGTLTDEQGYFKFEALCQKEYDLIFSYIGYKPVRHHHDFHHPYIELLMAPDTLVLGSVIVEAKRTASNLASITTSSLKAEELSRVATQSFGEVVSQISGVNTLSTGQNIVKPVIHGLHSNRILVMNNGVRHEYQNWGEEHAPEIDPSLVESIEVIKGAATVRFGPDALGGVILINPPEMELGSPFSGNVRLTGNSNGRSGEGSIELRKGFKWLSLMGGGSFIKQGDLHTPDYQLTNTGKEETSYYGSFRIHPLAELDIEGYYSHFEQELGILSGSVFGNLEDLQRAIGREEPFFTEDFSYDIGKPKQEVIHDLYKVKAQYTGRNQSLSIQYGYQQNQRKEFGVRRVDAPNIDLKLSTESVDVDWVHPKIGNFSGKLGFQAQFQDNENLPGTNTIPFIPNFKSIRYGAYAIESFKSGKNLIELGIRLDHFEADITGRELDNTIYRNTIIYNNVSGTIGYKRELNSYSSFQSNLGTAWRPPNVAELYRFGQHAFFIEYGLWRYTFDERFDFITTSQGILDESDREVPSEIGYKWINTYSIQRSDFQIEVTGYVNYINNYIYSKPGGVTRTPRGFFVFFLYDQTDALFWGVDASVNKDHSTDFSSTAKASYLWAQQINPKDSFAQLPPAKLEYTGDYKVAIPFFQEARIVADLSYTFEQFQHPRILEVEDFLFAAQREIDRFSEDASDFDLLPPPPGYFLANISVEGQKGGVSWNMQVRNVFNTRYQNYTDRLRYFADAMGRNFLLSLEYAW